jgi:hypothetical protein
MQSIVEVILLQERHDPLQKLSDIQTAYRWPRDIALGLEDSKPVVKFPSEVVKEYLWEVLATGVEPEPSETEKDTSEPFNFEPLSAESPAAETLGAPSTKTQPSTTRKQALKRGSIDFFDPESDTAASQAQAVTYLKGNDGNSPSWENISIADPMVKFTVGSPLSQSIFLLSLTSASCTNASSSALESAFLITLSHKLPQQVHFSTSSGCPLRPPSSPIKSH